MGGDLNKRIELLVDGKPVPLGPRARAVIRALTLIQEDINKPDSGGLEISWRGHDLTVVSRRHTRFTMPHQ